MEKYKQALIVAKWTFLGLLACMGGFSFLPQVFGPLGLLAFFLIPVALFTALLTYADKKIKQANDDNADNVVVKDGAEPKGAKKCPYCPEEINIEAIVCKHCGKNFEEEEKQKKIYAENRKAFKGCLTVIAIPILIFAAIIGYYLGKPPEPYKPDALQAYIFAEQAVKSQLKSPATAKFCGHRNAKVIEYEPGKFTVLGYVDSQNGFGALIRGNFNVSLEFVPPNTWNVTRIQIH